MVNLLSIKQGMGPQQNKGLARCALCNKSTAGKEAPDYASTTK
jgi:hypothetical protein